MIKYRRKEDVRLVIAKLVRNRFKFFEFRQVEKAVDSGRLVNVVKRNSINSRASLKLFTIILNPEDPWGFQQIE